MKDGSLPLVNLFLFGVLGGMLLSIFLMKSVKIPALFHRVQYVTTRQNKNITLGPDFKVWLYDTNTNLSIDISLLVDRNER